MPSVTPSRLCVDIAGMAERAPRISSTFRGLPALWDFRIASEPVVSTVKRVSEAFSATMPLIWGISPARLLKGEAYYPLITSSLASSSPFCTSETSTFFLHAFFPFREGCLCCCGAPVEEDITVFLENSTLSSRYPCDFVNLLRSNRPAHLQTSRTRLSISADLLSPNNLRPLPSRGFLKESSSEPWQDEKKVSIVLLNE